jgi:hypothetical protein
MGLALHSCSQRDNCYNMVAFQQELIYGRTSGADLGDYDITQHAAAFGANGIRVTTMDDLEAASGHHHRSPVDSSSNAELFAALHDGALDRPPPRANSLRKMKRTEPNARRPTDESIGSVFTRRRSKRRSR